MGFGGRRGDEGLRCVVLLFHGLFEHVWTVSRMVHGTCKIIVKKVVEYAKPHLVTDEIYSPCVND